MSEFKYPFLTEENTIDDSPQYYYAGFWDRFGALLLDGLILGISIGSLNLWNLFELRSFLLFLVITLAGLAYKPLMEAHYGATLGKMIVKLKVLDEDANPITMKSAWLRSIFTVIQSVIQIPIYYAAFNNEELIYLEGLEFNSSIVSQYPIMQFINMAMFAIIVTEVILLLTDTEKRQSLHDRIAGTVVVKQ